MVKNYPDWMNKEAKEALHSKYLKEDETAADLYQRISDTAQSIYPEINGLGDALFDSFWNGWLSPSTPVAANFGRKDHGLPVSCFSSCPQNSVNGIFKTAREIAMLSKNGGGCAVDMSDLMGSSPVTHWGRLYDTTASVVSQGQTRRGSVALYLDAEHPDILSFLNAKDVLKRGDSREKFDCNIAVKFSDEFMERVLSNEPHAVDVFSRVLELRMTMGSPYIFFSDNAEKKDPPYYKELGLKTRQSNLCAEVFQHTDPDHTFVCVLSSLVLSRYDEWKDVVYEVNIKGHTWELSVPMLAIVFLDAVCEEFIRLGRKIEGIETAVRSAISGRALGLGTLGLHDYFQKKGWAWGSEEAKAFDLEAHRYIRLQSEQATQLLATLYGVPDWCCNHIRRNTFLMAIAPTLSNSVICNGGSAGISPKKSNAYIYEGPSGIYLRKNDRLELVLESHGKNTQEVWRSIEKRDGSVQHLNFLSQAEKDVFKTALEIDQTTLLEHAALRQTVIDQGQSLNLFIRHTESAENIAKWHIQAWKLGLKSLYYVRSTSPLNKSANEQSFTLEGDKPHGGAKILIKTREDCIYCQKAKELLRDMNLDYEEVTKSKGKVPEIWFNEEKLQDGYTSLKKLLNLDVEQANECESCDG